MSTDNLLNRIADSLPDLNKSDIKVAKVILGNPDQATQSSIATLAQAAGVSEPTVNRFSKKFGASGFPDFKIRLAKCLVSGIPYVSQNVEPDDEVDTYTRKIFDSTVSTLCLVRDKVDTSQINLVVDKLIDARRIYFFGLGASGSVAKDAEHKFFRFNLPVSFHEDIMIQRMLASAGSPGDVFFIISHTGRTRELVEIAKLARESGATVVALTAQDSPLAKISDLLIGIDVRENTDEYMPMTSRIVHLVVLDVLATGVTIRRGPEFQPYLKKIKGSIASTRLAPE